MQWSLYLSQYDIGNVACRDKLAQSLDRMTISLLVSRESLVKFNVHSELNVKHCDMPQLDCNEETAVAGKVTLALQGHDLLLLLLLLLLFSAM